MGTAWEAHGGYIARECRSGPQVRRRYDAEIWRTDCASRHLKMRHDAPGHRRGTNHAARFSADGRRTFTLIWDRCPDSPVPLGHPICEKRIPSMKSGLLLTSFYDLPPPTRNLYISFGIAQTLCRLSAPRRCLRATNFPQPLPPSHAPHGIHGAGIYWAGIYWAKQCPGAP